MTSPRRSKKSGAQCAVQILDWDSPSTDTGTVKRRRSSCPENSGKHTVSVHDAIFEVQTPSDSGSGTSRSIDDNDKSDSLTEVEERISCIINENRSSKSNSESSDADIIIDNILGNPNENLFEQHDSLLSNRSKTFIKKDTPCVNEKHDTVSDEVQQDKKVRDKRLKTPAPIKKLNKTFDKSKNSLRLAKEPPKPQEKASVLPVYKSTVQGSIDLNSSQKKKVSTKLKLPFAPVRTMEKSKMNFFQNKPNLQGTKPSPLLSSPVRRTMSNEYVRLKFNNDTVVRRTINGKSVPKITPKIQSIIPESPIDSEDPFLNLSPNKKYTVTVNNKVRCDKDNYVIFDPNTGFAPDGSRQSRIPLKSPTGEKSRIPLKSPCGENSGLVRKSANVSDTDSGILSPNSPVETSEKGSAYYVNAAAFSESAKKFASDVDITILDPGLAKKAAEQIKIYTDWANHYLERARSRRRAGASGGGLARDCADGLLLADVLEGVTGLKVHRAHRKPRNPQQMLENVQCCLDFLHAQKVQGLEQVTAVDIRDAKLKAVLALFFALSRHKQATKQRTTPSSGNATNIGKNSSEDVSLSAVQRITGGSSCDEILTACTNNVDMTTLTANRQVSVLQTSIPLPASAAAARRAPPDKRPLPATPSHTGGKSGLSASSSRSTSPLGQGAVSFIPRAPTSSSGSRPNSSLLAPGSKIPSTLISQPQHQQTPSSHNGTPTKHSMLDKLKLFNKDKISNEKQSSKSTAVSKRTSSSSGFSSAKSERSDSSLSLNESSNTPNSHIKSTNLVGPKSIRQQSDTLSKDKSGKNVKPKLVSSKSPKETSTGFNKNSSKTSNSDKSRNSPKLPARDKESKLAAPKSISNTKLNQIDDHSRNSNSKMVKLSGSQMRLSEKRSDSTPDVKHHQNHENASPPSKSHGNQNQAASAQNFGQQNHTGIPKPTAAVKGTFKISKDDRHVINKSTNSQLSPIQSNSSLNSTNNVSALPFGREQSNLSKDITQKQTLAVSPMPVVNTGIHTHISQMSESSHSNSTHSTTGQHSNSSDSSVIYRPSSESGSEISKTATHSGNANKRIDMNTTYINEVINEAEISEKEAAQRRPLDKSVPKPTFDHNRTLTELNKRMENDSRSSTPSHCRDNSLGDDENPLMNVMPMRPLLRGYNSHLTLPMRTSGLTQKNIPGYPHHANTVKANFGRENMGLRDRINYGPGFSNPDYCDLEIASGYMSDGDCLRRININEMDCGRNNDIMDGYMSEGGASLYGRRLNYQQPSQLQQLDERRGRNRGMEGGSGVVYRVVGRTRSKADCGQQTERQPPAPRQDTTWKKYTDSPGVGTPPMNQPAPAPPSPSHGRKGERRAGHHSPQHHKREKLTAAQQLGIAPHPQYPPPNSSGQHPSRSGGSQLQSPSGGSSRPSSVSSGGNGSTCSSGKAKVPQSFGYVKRQNGVQQPAPQSNGPPQHGGRTAQVSAVPRTKVKVSGGTQTCTQDLQIHKNGIGPKSFSLGGTAAAQLSASVRERLLGSQSLPKPGTHEFAALFHHHRVAPRGGIKISDGSLSDTQTYSEVKSDYGIPYAPWLRHRSTKSEKLYPSMLQRSSESDYEPYYCLPVQYGPAGQGLNYGVSEPPSPSPRSALSPTHQPGNVMHTPRHSHHYPKKNDDVHGSTASLVSTASSLAAGAGSEERQAHEVIGVRKLRRELADAKEKVHTLTTQLTTNAHVVSAFEQSLSNMTQRLQQLTATAERKDSELTELRQTIELLRKQSIQAGLTTAHMQSMGIRADGVNVTGPEPGSQTQSSPQRTAHTGNGAITRHLSTDSVSSINSLSSGSSAPHDKKHKKKGWLRSSFTKAFSRNAKISKTAKHSSLGQLSSQDSSSGSHHYDDPHTIREGSNENSLEHSHETLDVKDKPCPPAKTEDQTKDKPDDSGLVDELKRQLREKDLVLTDIRLEALSSAHQLESLKDTVIKMRVHFQNEMLNLKQNNERLQRLVTSRSLAGSQSSLGTGGSAVEDPRRFSLADQATMHQATLDMHSQPLDLDFNCMSSTPTMDFSKKGSPKSSLGEPIYGNKAACELNENSETLLGALNGSSDLFANGLNTTDRLSGDYDINSVLPPPKSRELAIGESYSDIGVADSQGDTTDGKKIAIAVYLGQPETFQRYFEEVQDTLTESECRFYAKQSASAYNNHFEKQSSFDSPRLSQNRSPETETQDYTQINKSNTNSLKSNKSTHSNSYKNVYNSDSTINCNEFTIAYTYISGKTTWQNLDYIVRKTFKDYLSRIDLGTNLGLNTDSITSYHLGEATRGPEIGFPELLPCGYIIGTVNTLYICLEGVGSLAFDSLIPKNIVYRYVSLLSEHRRIILCGPSGTGKSYLAAKLAEFYVQKTQRRGNPAEAVATFNVDRKSCNELRAYLANIAEQCGAAAAGEEAALPSVVILDNLQHASALGDAFAGLLPPDNRNMPVIIGTMSQATCNTTNLQLHHNFRWLLTANHMEPVKGFLARYLRRKLFTLELRLGRREPALAAVLEWLPGVWAALNAFLEAHSSSDVTVGPRLFLACPMDLEASQAWFADVWNYSIVPYASEAVREGIALYGRRRHAAVDPLQHIKSSYPWREPNHSHTLRAITVEDIGIEESNQDSNTNNNQDPLLNMLMRLQEAANYSGNQSQDSDNASMDSNLTHDSSMGNEL
ncbi:protein sickie isoform X6 [Trichoplusia ni]|uniref:Protein sickie isoform X6 n=1 Tax=Trichoplusia ni TaxID=7111 RepID=A0A7E5VC81_TRINI|nr:protein sickie isoform X6 [Trichoplusia ni]